MEHCGGEFVAGLCAAHDDGSEGGKVGAGAGIGHLDDFAYGSGAPEFSDLGKQVGGDAAIFGPEAGAEGLLPDPETGAFIAECGTPAAGLVHGSIGGAAENVGACAGDDEDTGAS